MVRHGMTPMAALRSVTVVAELLGWEDRVGALAPGRYADVVAVPGDPRRPGAARRRPFVKGGGRILRWEDRAPRCRRRGHTRA